MKKKIHPSTSFLKSNQTFSHKLTFPRSFGFLSLLVNFGVKSVSKPTNSVHRYFRCSVKILQIYEICMNYKTLHVFESNIYPSHVRLNQTMKELDSLKLVSPSPLKLKQRNLHTSSDLLFIPKQIVPCTFNGLFKFSHFVRAFTVHFIDHSSNTL